MSTTLLSKDEQAAQLLRDQLPNTVSVDFERMFPRLSGFGVAKANRKRIDLLAKSAPVLRSALEADETVLYVSRGVVNDFVDQYFMGLVAHYINQSVIVATDRRFMFIRCDRRGRPRQFVNEIPYQAITCMKAGGFLTSFVVRWKKGCLALANLGKQDGKLLTDYQAEHASRPTTSNVERSNEQLNYLCPACYCPIDRIVDQCPRCTTYFKSPKIAALRSLILPGLGDLYLGHTHFALLEMAGAAVVLFMLIAVIASSHTSEELIIALIVFVVVIGIEHGLDSLLTRRTARKGLIADSGNLSTRDA